MKLASLLDSRQDGNDAKLQVFVMPAKAGIQKIFDNLDFLNLGKQNTSQFCHQNISALELFISRIFTDKLIKFNHLLPFRGYGVE